VLLSLVSNPGRRFLTGTGRHDRAPVTEWSRKRCSDGVEARTVCAMARLLWMVALALGTLALTVWALGQVLSVTV